MSREVRCDWSDLPKHTCAHCLGHVLVEGEDFE